MEIMSGGVSGGDDRIRRQSLYHYGRGDGWSHHWHVLLDDSVESVDVIGVIVDGPAAAIGFDQAVAAFDHITVANFLLVLGVTGQRVSDCVCELVLRVGVREVELGHGRSGGHGQRCGGGHGQRCGGADQRCTGWERCYGGCGWEWGGGEASGRGRERLQRGCHGTGGGRQERRSEWVSGVRVSSWCGRVWVSGGCGRVRQQSWVGVWGWGGAGK